MPDLGWIAETPLNNAINHSSRGGNRTVYRGFAVRVHTTTPLLYGIAVTVFEDRVDYFAVSTGVHTVRSV